MAQPGDTQDEAGPQTKSTAAENGLKPLAAGLATAVSGATASYLLLWHVLPILLPIPRSGIPTLALLLAAFLGSAFAGIEVMEMLHASRTPTLAAVTDSVVGGLRVIFCLAR